MSFLASTRCAATAAAAMHRTIPSACYSTKGSSSAPFLTLSFSGAGHLLSYHLGVATSLHRASAAGIDIPIVPGVMPITNYRGLKRFSDICSAEIPRWIEQHLISYEDDPDALKAFGAEVVTQMCEKLLAGGAPGIHFYTLNQTVPTLKIWNALGL